MLLQSATAPVRPAGRRPRAPATAAAAVDDPNGRVAALELLQWKEDVRDAASLVGPLSALLGELLVEEAAEEPEAAPAESTADDDTKPSRYAYAGGSLVI